MLLLGKACWQSMRVQIVLANNASMKHILFLYLYTFLITIIFFHYNKKIRFIILYRSYKVTSDSFYYNFLFIFFTKANSVCKQQTRFTLQYLIRT